VVGFTVTLPDQTPVMGLAAAGVIGGVWLLVRGAAEYRSGGRIRGTAASRIASLAVGEVLVSGQAEVVELSLVSPLQSAACVYYRSRVRDTSSDTDRTIFEEERAVGFRVRDASGAAVRVFPRGATYDVPARFDEKTGSWDGSPPGLMPRIGPAFGPGADRAAQAAALLTVHGSDAERWGIEPPGAATDGIRRESFGGAGLGVSLFASGSQHRHYTEARIEPGDLVTLVGRALPFADLADPSGADLDAGLGGFDADGPGSGDPEIAADLAEARAAGILEDDPTEAWGNAAIPGFGIGRPVSPPELDPAATPPPLAGANPAGAAFATAAASTFGIGPGELVIAASHEVPLVIATGPPGEAAARDTQRLVVGLLGAVLAIGSAMALAIVVSGMPR
jgi:hypothetical protein